MPSDIDCNRLKYIYKSKLFVQISSTSLVVGKNRRNDATSELITASPALIQFLVRSASIKCCLFHNEDNFETIYFVNFTG